MARRADGGRRADRAGRLMRRSASIIATTQREGSTRGEICHGPERAESGEDGLRQAGPGAGDAVDAAAVPTARASLRKLEVRGAVDWSAAILFSKATRPRTIGSGRHPREHGRRAAEVRVGRRRDRSTVYWAPEARVTGFAAAREPPHGPGGSAQALEHRQAGVRDGVWSQEGGSQAGARRAWWRRDDRVPAGSPFNTPGSWRWRRSTGVRVRPVGALPHRQEMRLGRVGDDRRPQSGGAAHIIRPLARVPGDSALQPPRRA